MATRRKRTKSLRTTLSLFVGTIVVALVAVVSFMAYTASSDIVYKSYVNQLENVNSEVFDRVDAFYVQQEENARFIAQQPAIVEAAVTGHVGDAAAMLSSLMKTMGFYENAFISTPVNDTTIVVDGVGGASVGQHWNGPGSPCEASVTGALAGRVAFCDPAKSPVTGKLVILVTAPILDGSRVVGILGLPTDIETLTERLVTGLRIGKTGFPVVTTSSGVVFAHPVAKNIGLNIKDFDWGRAVLDAKSGAVIRYNFGGQDKLLTVQKSTSYPFMTLATMARSDITGDTAKMAATLVFIGLGGIAAAIVVTMMLMKRRLMPISRAVSIANRLSHGELNPEISAKRDDETGILLAAMENLAQQLTKVVRDVKTAADNVASGSQQLSTSAQQMSQGATEQATSAEELSSSMEQIGANIQQNSDNSQQTEKIAVKAAIDAEASGKSVRGAVDAMRDIAQKTSIIEEIARQTNLLALNAAIEAARAGEHGRGFAVVASEVRKLAERSLNAAREIGERSSDTMTLAEKAGEMLQRLVPDIKRTAELVQEITAASVEQANGTGQMNTAILRLDQVVQQNAAASEQVASTAEQLSSQAEMLRSAIGFFRIKGDSTERPRLLEAPSTATAADARVDEAGRPTAGAARSEACANVIPSQHGVTNVGDQNIATTGRVGVRTLTPAPASRVIVSRGGAAGLRGDSLDSAFEEL